MGDVVEGSVSRERVLAAVLDGVLAEIETCSDDFGSQVKRLREVCFLSGKKIDFTASEEALSGNVIGLGDDGSLIVETGNKIIPYSQAAEIRVIEEAS